MAERTAGEERRGDERRREDLFGNQLKMHEFNLAEPVPNYHQMNDGRDAELPPLDPFHPAEMLLRDSETVFGNLQRFRAIPLLHPHTSVPSASGLSVIAVSLSDWRGQRSIKVFQIQIDKYICFLFPNKKHINQGIEQLNQIVL